MKRFITGALAAVLLVSQISVADVFAKTAEAVEQDAGSVMEAEETLEADSTEDMREEAASLSENSDGRGYKEAEYSDPESRETTIENIALQSEDDGIQLLAADFAGGGTETSPYIISSPEDLTRLATDVNGGESYSGVYFELTADITVTNWTPIGNYATSMIFSGIFNGGNHVITINGLAPASNPGREYQGLFGYVDGRIQNLTVAGTVHSNATNVGGIVGRLGSEGVIENCQNKASVKSNYEGSSNTLTGVGGIAGHNNGRIINCVNEGDVSGFASSFNAVGGIAGQSAIGGIESCYNTGSVTGTSDCGGIVGYISTGSSSVIVTIINCYNTGEISSNEKRAGGIVGYSSNTQITNCYNTGEISSDEDRAGGIAGYSSDTQITNCYYLEGTAEGGIGTADVPGQAESIGETAFAQQGTFENWDFGSIWKMSAVLGRPILVKSAEYEPQEEVPKASVDRPNSRLQGLIPGAKYDITYKDANGNPHTDTVTADENGNLEIKDEWTNDTVYIVKKSNSADVADSEAQELYIPKREPEISGSLTVTGESTKGAKDGKISGLEPGGRYQISEDGGKTWKDVTANAKGEIESLGSGSYEVRRPAGENTLPSKSVKVTIEASGTGNTKRSAAGNAGASGNHVSPKTGDSARPDLWLALSVVGAAGFMGVTATYYIRKRKSKQQ